MSLGEALLTRVRALPALPASVGALNAAASDERVGAARIVEILSKDPSLAAAVLRAANSGLYGGSVADLVTAVTRLGISTVVGLGTGVGVIRHMNQRAAGGTGFWQHSVAVAQTSRGLGRLLGQGREAERAFLVGLLHDIGVLALELSAPDEYARVRERFVAGVPRIEAERELLGFDHCEAGSMLAVAWKLPAPLVAAIKNHHDRETEDTTACLLQVADLLVRSRLPHTPADEQLCFVLSDEPCFERLIGQSSEELDIEAMTFQIDDELQKAIAFVEAVFKG